MANLYTRAQMWLAYEKGIDAALTWRRWGWSYERTLEDWPHTPCCEGPCAHEMDDEPIYEVQHDPATCPRDAGGPCTCGVPAVRS
jgi:hypothetical protein